jgi:hypothetical protein
MNRQFRTFKKGRGHILEGPFRQLVCATAIALALFFQLDLDAQGDTSGPRDFVGSTYSVIGDRPIRFGFASSITSHLGEKILPYRLQHAIEPGGEFQLTGYEFHIRPGTNQQNIYYTVSYRSPGTDTFVPVTRDLDPYRELGDPQNLQPTALLISAEDLIAVTGGQGPSPLTGCDQMPGEGYDYDAPLPSREASPALENLADIRELRDALLADMQVPVPALTEGFSLEGADCSAFILGENELGPFGQSIVEEIMNIGPDREVSRIKQTSNGPVRLGHSDIPTEYFMDLPNEYFSHNGENLCPNLGQMSSQEKLGLWVWIFASLAHDESTCQEVALNRDGTHDDAEGLLQINSDYYPSHNREGEPIYGREARGPGCFGATDAAVAGHSILDGTTVLMDHEDNLACGVQVMGNTLCGSLFPTANPTPRDERSNLREYRYRPVEDRCRPMREDARFFGNNRVYWAMPKGGHGEADREWMKDRIREFPACQTGGGE